MGSYLSIITLNVNGLNVPTKRQRLAEWIQKRYPYIRCLQETHFIAKDTYRLKVKLLSRVWSSETPWTAACQAPPSMGFFQAKVLEWVAIAFSRREWQDILKVMKEKNLHPRLLYPARISFKHEGEIKSFTDKQKLREFSTTKSALQQKVNDLL